VRQRKFPIAGDGGGVWSWIHLDDAASATVLAPRALWSGHLQHCGRRPRPGPSMAARACENGWSEAAPAFPALRRPVLRGRGSGGHGDGVPRRLEREGETGARLDAAIPKLATGFRRSVWNTRRRAGIAQRGVDPRLTRCRVCSAGSSIIGDVAAAAGKSYRSSQ
jgi:hypothetical protein